MKSNQKREKNYSWRPRGLQLLAFGLIGVLFYGCYPQGAEFIDELDLVVTIEDDDTNYDQFLTFVMPDTIAYVSSDPDDELDPAAEARILSKVKENLADYGWQEEADPINNGSDVVVVVTVIDNLNITISDGWWGYWGWWPGWGYYPPFPGGGWYPGYPGYCCYNQIYAWREGTLLIEMVDPNDGMDVSGEEIDPIPLIWMGALNGLLEGSEANLQARTDRGIDQVFVDSPYLDKN